MARPFGYRDRTPAVDAASSRLDHARRTRWPMQAEAGADGVIVGCTEVTLLIGQADVNVAVFDTTHLHAEAAMAFALDEQATLPAAE
jgi:aspartate/glutamate racemase